MIDRKSLGALVDPEPAQPEEPENPEEEPEG